MGKETREKTRNQRQNAPYNASNSSFAQRITTKVAEYIAPTWAGSWLFHHTDEQESTSTNPNSIQVQVEINHVENPPKRPCLPNHNNVTNSNNKTALIYKSHTLGNETCSPILNSERHIKVGNRDFQLPGPSGYTQPIKPAHNLFVASTPAFNVNRPSGENGSDSGESTSGCSSLVSQSNKLRLGGMGDLGKSKSLFPNRQISTMEITKNQNKSSGPQFDSSVLNSSSPGLNKSVNLSPFYPGRTMYGGASTYRKLSIGSNHNKSATSPSIFQPSFRRSSLCNQSKVNPSPTTLPKMSVVAENILKTINSMTPATRVMSMPRPEEVNASPVSLRGTGSGVKRKLLELQIPTIVNNNLNHLKGTERKNALSQSTQEVLTSSSSSSDEDLDYAIVSHDAKRSLKEKMKRQRRGRASEEKEEVHSKVHLPHAVLKISSLPVIDIDIGKSSLDVSFSDPVECKDFNISSESSLLSVSSSSSDQTNVNNTNTSVNSVNNSESNNSSAKPKLNIAAMPVQVTLKSNIPLPRRSLSSKQDTWDCDVCMTKGNLSGGLCKACYKPQNVSSKVESAPVVSVSDKSAASTTSLSIVLPKTTNAETGFGDMFKKPSGNWDCLACMISNKPSDEKCIACETAKPVAVVKTPAPSNITSSLIGFGDKFKTPSGNWECSACMISNKPSDEKCIACETAKPGTVGKTPAPSNIMSSVSGFGEKFKTPSGNWECSACMISNKPSDEKCIACETARPGVAVKKSASNNLLSGPKFPFATSESSGFKFGIDKVDAAVKTSTSSAPSISFGIPASTAQASTTASSTTPTFSFGMPKAQDISTTDKKETSTITPASSVLNKISSQVVSSTSNSITSTPLFSSSLSTTSSVSTSSSPSFSLTKAAPATTVATSPTPSFSFKSPISSSSTIAPVTSAPSFGFGTSNGPLAKPAETKPEAKESPKSLFGTGATSFLNNTSEKPLGSLFGNNAHLANNTDNKLLNSFDTKKITFDITPTTNGGEPPAKMLDFGKPANAVEPAKPFVFGTAAFEKPKENSPFGNVSSNATPPAFPASKPAENALFSFGATAAKPVANAFCTSSNPSAPMFGFGATSTSNSFAAAPAQSAPQSNIFAATPAAAPTFNFNATPTNNSNFAAAPQTQQAPMFNAGSNLFGNPSAPATAAPAPMFGASSNPNPAPFTFGATNNTSAGFAFGSQNSTPAASGGAFTFGGASAPAAPPAFDPNMRPSFNFTAGTTAPTFNAQPGLTAGSTLAARKYKTATRRKK